MGNYRKVVLTFSVVLLGLAFAAPPAVADDVPPATPAIAVAPDQPQPVLAADDLADLAVRDATNGELEDFHGGDIDWGDQGVAWAALAVGGAALVIALIAL